MSFVSYIVTSQRSLDDQDFENKETFGCQRQSPNGTTHPKTSYSVTSALKASNLPLDRDLFIARTFLSSFTCSLPQIDNKTLITLDRLHFTAKKLCKTILASLITKPIDKISKF